MNISEDIKKLIDRPEENYCFRLHKERVFYVSEKLMKVAASTSHNNLESLGVCFGKFTKSKKFMLNITALPYLSEYSKVRSYLFYP